MAEELKKTKMNTFEENPEFEHQLLTTDNCELFVEKAKECLLLRQFKRCHKMCLAGISVAKTQSDEARAEETVERLCVVCIQALAELDQWQDVLPMIQNVYGGVETCPATVIQLCILMHVKVKEFSQCHAVASIWLRSENNSRKTGYDRVATLFVIKVMIPRGQFQLIPPFLNNNTHLKQDSISAILKECESVHTRLETEIEKSEKCVKTELSSQTDSDQPDSITEETDQTDQDSMSVLQYVKYFGCMIASKLAYPSISMLLKIAAASVAMAMFLKISLDGDLLSRLGQATLLWENAIQILKTVFSPYRPGR
ncbi:peroxisome assembly protein 26-like [Mya arenaria]|uniref:peroxisome assembly protein 26-like n=1 Tax=Mya arenaria TaxID=6604 RepID=UPI0022E4F642|nr:peroxisome assembly protein 26-like [Mya arenaria]